jgi:hypothetical protein
MLVITRLGQSPCFTAFFKRMERSAIRSRGSNEGLHGLLFLGDSPSSAFKGNLMGDLQDPIDGGTVLIPYFWPYFAGIVPNESG